jgi:hypothetical protein
MSNSIEDLFVVLRIVSDVALVLISLFFRKKLARQRVLWIIIFSCLFDAVFYLVGEYLGLNRAFLPFFYSAFTIIEFAAFSYFFFYHVRNKQMRNVIILTSLGFVIFNIVFTLFADLANIDSIPIGIEAILIFVFFFYYLFEQTNGENGPFIYNKYDLWIVAGIMIYLAGSFFIYVLGNQVDIETLGDFWLLTNVLYVLKNIFFAIGIFIFIKQSKTSPPKSRSSLN